MWDTTSSDNKTMWHTTNSDNKHTFIGSKQTMSQCGHIWAFWHEPFIVSFWQTKIGSWHLPNHYTYSLLCELVVFHISQTCAWLFIIIFITHIRMGVLLDRWIYMSDYNSLTTAINFIFVHQYTSNMIINIHGSQQNVDVSWKTEFQIAMLWLHRQYLYREWYKVTYHCLQPKGVPSTGI